MARRKPTIIRFFGPVLDITVNKLLAQVDRKLSEGQREFLLLMSSNGGSIFHGLSAYNYLKGIPATITTHNFGHVDSVSLVIFCSGAMRFSVPQASFLLHGASTTINQTVQVDDRQLEESLVRLRKDLKVIANIVSETTGKSVAEIENAMKVRTILSPADAMEWGLINETRSALIPEDAEIISIQHHQPEHQRCND
jgi:ATP-dependent protease ClpP protease subunit